MNCKVERECNVESRGNAVRECDVERECDLESREGV